MSQRARYVLAMGVGALAYPLGKAIGLILVKGSAIYPYEKEKR